MDIFHKIILFIFIAGPTVAFCGLIKLYVSFKGYRLKEYNQAYDCVSGEGKGWIYVSNIFFFRSNAEARAKDHHLETGLKTEVVEIWKW